MENNQLEAMLTARQVAEFLQVSISTVRRWSDRGMLQFYRIGSRGDRRYRRDDVMRFLHESTVGGPDQAAEAQPPARFSEGR
ncbi:MAG: helix-turn-helix domain-containing protein [Dehalococcoidia bacterium]